MSLELEVDAQAKDLVRAAVGRREREGGTWGKNYVVLLRIVAVVGEEISGIEVNLIRQLILETEAE